jgi:hypothetical protein
MADIDDRPDAIEDTDSTDGFFDKLCSDGLLGGNDGATFSDAGCEGLLGGSEGTCGSLPSHFFITGAGSTSFGVVTSLACDLAG